MNKEELKDKFLEMRINGETFEFIATELKVSKQTLINWSKENDIKESLQIARTIKYQKILKIYKQNRDTIILVK
jgi:DNA-binding XRE family transcriptional regulator